MASSDVWRQEPTAAEDDKKGWGGSAGGTAYVTYEYVSRICDFLLHTRNQSVIMCACCLEDVMVPRPAQPHHTKRGARHTKEVVLMTFSLACLTQWLMKRPISWLILLVRVLTRPSPCTGTPPRSIMEASPVAGSTAYSSPAAMLTTIRVPSSATLNKSRGADVALTRWFG